MYRLATVTTARNQFLDFENWKRFHNEYKDEVMYHIIVDNASDDDYKKLYSPYFQDSVIVELSEGMGVTGGYNAGIRYVQQHFDVDYILFIMQDMNIPRGGITVMVQCLEKDYNIGVIAPVNLFENHSDIIREHGGIIKWDLTIKKNFIYEKLSDSIPVMLDVDFLCGGNYMFRSKVFNEVGLFDENIFMYGDETDILLRVKKQGYKIVSTTKTVCWHEHIYQDKVKRLPSDHALYYTARNYFYLIKKHKNNFILFLSIFKSIYTFGLNFIRFLIKERNFTKIKFMLKGYNKGLFE